MRLASDEGARFSRLTAIPETQCRREEDIVLNYASAVACSLFRNIIAHKSVVPSNEREEESENKRKDGKGKTKKRKKKMSENSFRARRLKRWRSKVFL